LMMTNKPIFQDKF